MTHSEGDGPCTFRIILGWYIVRPVVGKMLLIGIYVATEQQ